MKRAILGIFTAVVIVALFIVLCTFVRRPYERVLLDRFGNLIGEDHQARLMYNWYFKLPTDSVVRIDTRLHLYTGPLEEVVTARKEPISIRAYAAWRIVDPVKFYRTTGGSDTRALEFLDQKIRGLVKGKLVNHTLDELFNTDKAHVQTASMESEIAKDASDGAPDPTSPGGRTSGLRDQGLEIVQVGFSRMAFSPQNAQFVYLRMEQELIKQAIDNYSQGVAKASEIRTKGDTDAAKIVSEATADAAKTRGQADQQAGEAISKVQASPEARELYQFWKSLEFAKSALAKNSILVLPTDSDWLKALFTVPKSTTQPKPITPDPSANAAPQAPEPKPVTPIAGANTAETGH